MKNGFAFFIILLMASISVHAQSPIINYSIKSPTNFVVLTSLNKTKKSFDKKAYYRAIASCRTKGVDMLILSTPTEENVRIKGEPWFKAMELERKYLLSLDSERLLETLER